MTQYAAAPTLSTGNVLTATHWDTYVRDNLDAIGKTKYGWAVKVASQSIANSTLTALTWSSLSLVDVALVSDTLIPTYAGVYWLGASISWATNSTGMRLIAMRINGATVAEAKVAAVTGVETTCRISCFKALAASDNVDVVCQQNSGGALVPTTLGEFQMFMVSW